MKVPRSACSLPPASYSVPCPRFLLRLANPLRLFPDQFLQGTICSFLGGGDLGREPGVLPPPTIDSGPLTSLVTLILVLVFSRRPSLQVAETDSTDQVAYKQQKFIPHHSGERRKVQGQGISRLSLLSEILLTGA